jgi:hypothetical protein
MLRTAYELCSICFVICCDNNLLQTCTTYHKLKQENMKQALGILCFLRRCGISHIWISMSTALAKKILYLSSQVTDNKFSSKRRRLLTFVLNLLIVASHSQTLKKYRKTFSPIPSSSVCNAETSKSVAIAICLTCLTFNG